MLLLTETNYLDIRQTDLYEICSDGRTLAVDERPKVIFSIPQGTLPWQPIFLLNESTPARYFATFFVFLWRLVVYFLSFCLFSWILRCFRAAADACDAVLHSFISPQNVIAKKN